MKMEENRRLDDISKGLRWLATLEMRDMIETIVRHLVAVSDFEVGDADPAWLNPPPLLFETILR